ncbi:MAG: histidinol-phosphate transaminase [Betaproteobacteria bacterium]
MTLPVRAAVLASPDYPFVPIDAPIKLDQNEASEDFPAHLKALVLERLSHTKWHRYTDLNSEALCAAIAQYEGWSPSGVVVTTGSNVLIALLIQLAALDKRVVTVKPNFSLYGLDAKLLGAALTEVPLRSDFSIDVDGLISSIRDNGDDPACTGGVIYLPQPHAPTGSIVTSSELEKLALASSEWLTVIDEAYHQFAGTNSTELARSFPNVLLLRTFSKAWGLAGLRIGYALASDEVARQLRKLVPPFAVSVMQTVAAEVALANAGYVRERVDRTVRERERIALALKGHPSWKVYPSSANFLLIRTPDAASASEQLLKAGVLVRRQDAYAGLEGCIRVTVGTVEENDAFLRAAGV